MSEDPAYVSTRTMPDSSGTGASEPRFDTSLFLIMAVACGIFVANIYYNQPILALLQQAFPDAIGLVNAVPMATQLGFAGGLFFLVPLGDRVNRRTLILGQALALIVGLACIALAPNAWVLVLASVLVGVSGSVAQQIVPFAAELAAPTRRGQVVGVVMSGVLCGLLLGRAVGGVSGNHWGWRATFWLGAVMTALAWLMLLVKLPSSRPQSDQSYVRLLRSLLSLWREEPLLRRATCIQAMLFGAFIGLWTVLALHMQSAYGLGADMAGLMGIVGAVGILIAPVAGRMADHGGPHRVIGAGGIIMLLSYPVLGLWGSMIGLLLGIILLDLGEQLALISNQHVIYALRPEARSRLNTVLMSGMFIGGAAGSWVAGISWRIGGWPAVCLLGGLWVLIALLIHFYGRIRQGRQARSR